MKTKLLQTLLISLALLFFSSCEETDPESPEGLLIANAWEIDGVYTADGTQITGLDYNISLRFTNALAIRSMNINGIPGPVLWSLNANGDQLTLNYLTGFNLNATGSQTLNVRISANSFVIEAPENQDIVLFGGLITLPRNNELRFRVLGSEPADPAPVTDSDLTTGTWTAAQGEGGIYNIAVDPNTLQQQPNFTLKFRTILGVNTLTINGLPSPATWSLNAGKTELTINYPTGTGTFSSITLQIQNLSNSSLIFRNSSEATFFGIGFTSTNELRLVQEPS